MKSIAIINNTWYHNNPNCYLLQLFNKIENQIAIQVDEYNTLNDRDVKISRFDAKLSIAEFYQTNRHRAFDAIFGIVQLKNAQDLMSWKSVQREVPTISFLFQNPECNYIGSHEELSSRYLVEHLYDLGIKKIGFIQHSHDTYAQKRKQSFISTMKELDLEINPKWNVEQEQRTAALENNSYSKDFPSNELFFNDLIETKMGKTPPEALIFLFDRISLDFYRFCIKTGKQVPNELAIASCDGILDIKDFQENISHCSQDFSGIVKKAFSLIKKMYDERSIREGINLFLPPQLKIKNSTKLISSTLASDRFKKVISLKIQEHYQRDDLSELLAAEQGQNQYYFMKKFKRQFGVSFNQYLLNFRLKKVLDSILSDKSNTVEIAEHIYSHGFNSQQHFYKAFKDKYKMSPLEYKKKSGH